VGSFPHVSVAGLAYGDRAMPTMSQDWQREAIEADAAGTTAYLDRVADMPLLRSVARTSLDALQLSPGQRVLEVGCGSGVFIPQLVAAVEPGGHVTGIDCAPALVQTARNRMEYTPSVTVREADAYSLPFADDAFDAAHCERVLMHLVDPRSALREMQRVVRPGGRVVAAEPDWGGLQIASSDPEAARLLVAAWVRGFAQPRMGLELLGAFADIGLTHLTARPVVPVVIDYGELLAYGLDLGRNIVDLDACGVLAASRSRAVLDEWADASEHGRFFGYIGVFVIAGCVPIHQSQGRL
jgi:SAM-dependent methyltransferase